MRYHPAFLNLTGKLSIPASGGATAESSAAGLFEAASKVVILAFEVTA